MSNPKLTLACLKYDRTTTIHKGFLKLEGVDLRLVELTEPRNAFARVFQGEFDVSEFSITEYIYYTSRNKSEFIGVPVFPAKRFRHAFIFCNAASDIREPGSLSGKKIGFADWVQSAGIWIRGILEEEYGISGRQARWYAVSMHHWDDRGEKDNVEPRNGATINWLENNGRDVKAVMESALLKGTIDAMGVPFMPDAYRRGDKRIKRLFENYKDVEQSYFKKTRIFPIMHVLVARKSLVEEIPDLPRKLFELFSRSKTLARRENRLDRTTSLVWPNHYWDEEEVLFQGDPWAYGLDKNRHILEKIIYYCFQQGVAERMLRPEELFHPSTWELTEDAISLP